jgi:hypothetical protein
LNAIDETTERFCLSRLTTICQRDWRSRSEELVWSGESRIAYALKDGCDAVATLPAIGADGPRFADYLRAALAYIGIAVPAGMQRLYWPKNLIKGVPF